MQIILCLRISLAWLNSYSVVYNIRQKWKLILHLLWIGCLTFTLLKITTHRSWLRKTTLWQLFGKRRGNGIRWMLTIIELIKSARFRSRIHTWQGLACFITTTKLRSSWLVTRGSAVQEAGTCSLYFVVETAQQHWYVCSCKRSLLFRRSRYVEGTLIIKK